MSDNNANNSRHGSGFVVDGSGRLADGVRDAIKKEVEAEFSERLAKAKWLVRLRLLRQMRSEIDQRAATAIAKQMPSKAALW